MVVPLPPCRGIPPQQAHRGAEADLGMAEGCAGSGVDVLRATCRDRPVAHVVVTVCRVTKPFRQRGKTGNQVECEGALHQGSPSTILLAGIPWERYHRTPVETSSKGELAQCGRLAPGEGPRMSYATVQQAKVQTRRLSSSSFPLAESIKSEDKWAAMRRGSY